MHGTMCGYDYEGEDECVGGAPMIVVVVCV